MSDKPEPTIHKLKCWPTYFQQVADGTKRFEIRKNDRDFKVGDTLHLEEWDPKAESGEGAYTGRFEIATITYILPLWEWQRINNQDFQVPGDAGVILSIHCPAALWRYEQNQPNPWSPQ